MKRELAEADRSLEEDKRRLEEMKADFPARDILREHKRASKRSLRRRRLLLRETARATQYLKSNAAEQTDADDCAAARDSAQKLGSRRRVSKVSAIVTAILAVATALPPSLCIRFAFPNSSFPPRPARCFCARRSFSHPFRTARRKKFDALCAQWDADGEDSLLANIALGERRRATR